MELDGAGVASSYIAACVCGDSAQISVSSSGCLRDWSRGSLFVDRGAWSGAFCQLEGRHGQLSLTVAAYSFVVLATASPYGFANPTYRILAYFCFVVFEDAKICERD